MNPYYVLGLPTNSTIQEVKSAFKRLVKIWHPDVNKTPEASKKFIEIKRAYEMITEPQGQIRQPFSPPRSPIIVVWHTGTSTDTASNFSFTIKNWY